MPPAACCSSGQCSLADSQQAAHGDHQVLNGSSAGADNATASNNVQHSRSDLHKQLDFRILTEPIALQPNKSVYGVPYDLVDTSQGSAVSEMLQQLREADTALAAVHMIDAHGRAEE